MYKSNYLEKQDGSDNKGIPILHEIDNFRKKFSGEIILPGDDKYEELSIAYLTKGKPAVIFIPQNPEDVASALLYSKSNSLIVSIRSGGHGLPGFATNNGGSVIILSSLNKVEVVDKQNNIVRVGAGALWGNVANSLKEHNLAISSGDTKSVGVGGLTLGGGFGWMVRKVGLTIDNVLSAKAVTADGKILIVNAKENQDLFWALRGGGGNFCVVTSFDFQAHYLDKIVGGILQFNIEDLENILKGWRDNINIADEKLTSMIRIMPPMFGNPPAVIVQLCYAGRDSIESKNAIKPFLNLAQPTQNNIKEMDYCDFLEESMHPPDTIKIAVKNMFAESLNDELIMGIVNISGKQNSPAVQIRSVNGAMNRIASDVTAFPYRKSEVLISAGIFMPKDISEEGKVNAFKSWDSIKVYGKGVYVNFLSEDEKITDIYPNNTYIRLQEIKKKYDPENLFNLNYNIKA